MPLPLRGAAALPARADASYRCRGRRHYRPEPSNAIIPIALVFFALFLAAFGVRVDSLLAGVAMVVRLVIVRTIAATVVAMVVRLVIVRTIAATVVAVAVVPVVVVPVAVATSVPVAIAALHCTG